MNIAFVSFVACPTVFWQNDTAFQFPSLISNYQKCSLGLHCFKGSDIKHSQSIRGLTAPPQNPSLILVKQGCTTSKLLPVSLKFAYSCLKYTTTLP